MEPFILYTLKSSFCLSAGYILHYLLMKHITFHRFKRFVLLAIIGSSLIIPVIIIQVEPESDNSVQDTQKPAYLSALQLVIPEKSDPKTPDQTHENNAVSWLMLIYLTGVTIQVLLLAFALKKMLTILRKSEKIKFKGSRLAILPKDVSPFSFGRYIMISDEDLQKHGDEIIRHEQTHLNALHGLDSWMIELYLVLTWYNPFSWLMRNEIKQNHEFEADGHVLRSGFEPTGYQLLLVKTAVGEQRFRLANQFNQINIKTRINMMNKKKSSPLSLVKVLFFIPLIALMVQVFAQKESKMSGSIGKNPTSGKYLELNAAQLKSLGFSWTQSGLFYKNNRIDRQDKSVLCLYFTDSTYSASIIIRSGERIRGHSAPEKFLKKQKPANFDFYPMVVSNFNGFRTLDMSASLNNPEEKLLPVQVNLAELNAGNRKDTLVFWFRLTASLKNILPQEVNASSFLQPCPADPPKKLNR